MSAERIILFDLVFAILLASYGVGVGTADLSTVTSLEPPKLAPLPPAISCNWWDYVCSGTKDITQATAYVGWAIVNGPVVIIYFIAEGILFLNIILQITFSPQFGANGVPVLGFFWVGLQVFVLFEVFRMFRGSSSGV